MCTELLVWMGGAAIAAALLPKVGYHRPPAPVDLAIGSPECENPNVPTTSATAGLPPPSPSPSRLPQILHVVVRGVASGRVKAVERALAAYFHAHGACVELRAAPTGSTPIPTLWLHCDIVTRNVPVSTHDKLCVAVVLNAMGPRGRTIVLEDEGSVNMECSQATFEAILAFAAQHRDGAQKQ